MTSDTATDEHDELFPLTDPPLTELELRHALEAMLLVTDAPAPVTLLAAAVPAPAGRVLAALQAWAAELDEQQSGMDLRFAGDGWRLYTRTAYAPYVERMLLDGNRPKLTRAALETLAVVAYRQPLTRAQVSAVRGVNVDWVVRSLLARGLLCEADTDPDTGAVRYRTTELFLERIGLASLADLPALAPLLPEIDVIDEINDSLDTEPRFLKLRGGQPAAGIDLDPGDDD